MQVIFGKYLDNKRHTNVIKPCQSNPLLFQSNPENFTLSITREGVIIDDGKTTLFYELVTLKNVVLTSRNDLRGDGTARSRSRKSLFTMKRR